MVEEVHRLGRLKEIQNQVELFPITILRDVKNVGVPWPLLVLNL